VVAALSTDWQLTLESDEQEERRALVGERLHRRTDAEELVWFVVADTSFCATTRTSPDCTSDLQRAELAALADTRAGPCPYCGEA
jgi:hypothetical protein